MTIRHPTSIMNHRVLQQVAPPQSVYERPANLFVARFIGNPPMNTMEGRVVERDGARAMEFEGGCLPLDPAHAAAAEAAGATSLVIGVRPENLAFSDDGALHAVIAVVESLGHERHLICRLTDGQMIIVRQNSDVPRPAEGTAVRLAADPMHLHVFDAVTERRIDPL